LLPVAASTNKGYLVALVALSAVSVTVLATVALAAVMLSKAYFNLLPVIVRNVEAVPVFISASVISE
jgi:hypothetical protein